MVECGIEIDYKHQTVKANKIGSTVGIVPESFTIKYRKCSSNRNADFLSRITSPESQHCATTELKVGPSREEIKEHQSNDSVFSEIQHINNRTVPEKSPLFNRWLQLWPQLKI